MIHPTAVVHKDAKIDPSVEIGPWCTIGANVVIGKNTKLISHVVVDGCTEIGEGNVIFPFAVVGGIPQDLKYKGEPTKLIIGNRNTIRESVTLNLGTVQGGGVSRVGDDNLFMAYSHLGHDSIVSNHCILANSVALAGHVFMDDYATLGGQCGVVQFCRVGKHAYVAGQSGIERDVPPFATAMGQRPVTVRGVNIVGLRRRGFSAETIGKINDAMKLWIRPDVAKEECLAQMEAQFGDCAEVQELIKFIRVSEVGVAR